MHERSLTLLDIAIESGFTSNAAQLAELKKAGCKRIYEEKMSGRNVDRPELTRCLDRLDEGDTLIVWRLDRLGRSLTDLLEIVTTLQSRKVAFVSLKEKFDTSSASGCLGNISSTSSHRWLSLKGN